MKIKTSDLIGPSLNWAVAKCKKLPIESGLVRIPDYVTDWYQTGRIIEQERIVLDGATLCGQWIATLYVPDEEPWEMQGPTALVAAMRSFVASCFGEEVEIPNEIV